MYISFAATAKQTSALLKRSIHVNSFILHSLQLLNESEMMPESPLNDIQTDMMMMMIWTYWEGTQLHERNSGCVVSPEPFTVHGSGR